MGVVGGDLFGASNTNWSAGFGCEATVYIMAMFTASGLYVKGTYISKARGSASNSDILDANFNVWLNDIQQQGISGNWTSGYPENREENLSKTYACDISLPVKVRITAYVNTGCNYAAGTYLLRESANIDQTFMLRTPVAGLNLCSTNTTVNQMFILPILSGTSSSFYFFKNITGYRMWVQTIENQTLDSVIRDGERSRSRIEVYTNECMTLFKSSNIWYIANYHYGSALNGTTSTALTTNANKILNASAGHVNMFNVNNSADRQSGDNFCILPAASTGAGKLTFIVYCGDKSGKTNGNALVFVTADGSNIDNGIQKPYILVNESGAASKSCGAVFISDGSRWYIVGFVTTTFGTSWISSSNTGNTTMSRASSNVNFYLIANGVADRSLSLPLYDSTVPANGSIISIIKGQTFSGGGIYIYANSGNSINENTSVYYPTTSTINKTNWSCFWMVSEKRPGESFYHYYPVLTYFP